MHKIYNERQIYSDFKNNFYDYKKIIKSIKSLSMGGFLLCKEERL